MADKILTITQITTSGVNIQFKLNDGYSLPSRIIEDALQSFRTWQARTGQMLRWTTDHDREISLLVPSVYFGWILSSMPINDEDDNFRIDSPCSTSLDIVE